MLGELQFSDLLLVLIIILVSMVLHEAMHAFASHALGDTTAKDEGRLTLNPLSHIDPLTTVILPAVLMFLGLPPIMIAKPVPFDPDRVKFGEFGAALVALAGPFTNLVLAIIASFFVRFFGAGGELGHVLLLFMQINIVFFVFNMIPFPPLDGSRLLYAFAPPSVQRVMAQIESAGLMVTLLVFLLAAPFILPFVSNISKNIFVFLLR